MTLNRTHVAPIFALLIVLIHWLNQWHGTYGLMFDEAQYWFWAKHPAWGYYSKPPMIAWLIAASTMVFGDGNFGVKMLSPLIQLATGFVLRATSRQLGHSAEASNWVLATYITLPYVTGNATFFTTDVPLQLCWAVALYGALTAIRADKPCYWLLAGVGVGLGMLSKYTMIAFGASCLLAVFITPQARRQLGTIWPWLAGMFASALLLPNLVWNAAHHFVTFNHTSENVFSKAIEIYPDDMLTFILSQFVVFGPILLFALLRSIGRISRSDDSALLHCFVWPLAITGILVSLVAGAQAHWISPVYLAGVLIVVPSLLQRAPSVLLTSLILHLVFIALFYAAPTVMPMLKHNPLARLFVWNELATELKPLIVEHQDALLMTNERKIAAAFTYQLHDLRGSELPVYKWKMPQVIHDHFDMLTEGADLSGKPILLVLRYWDMEHDMPSADAKLLRKFVLQGYKFEVYLLPAGGDTYPRL